MTDRHSNQDNTPRLPQNFKMIALLVIPFIFEAIVNGYLMVEWFLQPFFPFHLIERIYNVNTLIFPAYLMVCGIGAWYLARAKEQTRFIQWALVCIAMGGLILAVRFYATHIEPFRLQVREITIPTEKVDQSLRVLHISDIQSPAVGQYETTVFRKIKEMKPDLILHTGDLLQSIAPATWESESLVIRDLINQFDPPMGFFSIVGNTDGYTVTQMQQGLGLMRVLSDEPITLHAGNTTLRVYGLSLDESWKIQHKEKVREWLNAGDPRDFTILLGHVPNFILDVQDLPVDLCLAGHTHGGQIRIPFFGPITVLCEIPRKWGSGYHSIGATHLNVSAGIGSEHAFGMPSIRVFCPPEMTLFNLAPQA